MEPVGITLTKLLAERGELVAELQRLVGDAEREGRRLTSGEQGRFDELKSEIAEADQHAENLRVRESLAARSAVRVAGARSGEPLEKGIGLARLVQCMLAARGNDLQAIELARRHFPDSPQLTDLLRAKSVGAWTLERAAVAPANTVDPAWAAALVHANQLSGELIELAMPETVLGQLEGLRRVPFNVKIPREVAAITQAKWVGQGQSKPVGKGSFDFLTIPYTKAAIIVIFSDELARFSDPSAERLIRDGLVRSLSQFLDTEFLSSNAPVANTSPGGILYNLPVGQQFASSGSTWESVLWDITHAINLLDSGLTAARRPTWIMSRANATSVGFLPNAFGVPAFPTVAASGRLAGLPVIASPNMPSNIVLLVDADMILYAADPAVRLDISREASVQADTDPSTPPTGLISLWQQNLIGILAEKYEWWGRARDQAIVEITGVTWSTAAPPGAPVEPVEPGMLNAAAAHSQLGAAAPRTTTHRRQSD